MPSEVCAHSVIATLESTRVSSSTAMAYAACAARAADLLGERDAHQPELAQLRDDARRGSLRAVELLRHGRDLPLGEVAHGALDHLGARRAGRSAWRAQYRMSVRKSSDVRSSRFVRYRRRRCRPPPRPAPRCATATTAGSSEVVLEAAQRVRRARLRPDLDARTSPRRPGSPPAASTTTSGARSGCCISICDQLMEPLLERARRRSWRSDAPPADAAARARARCGSAHVVEHRDHMLVFQQERHVIERGAQWRGVRSEPQALRAARRRRARARRGERRGRASPTARLALSALLGMVNHTAQWYRPRGRLSAERDRRRVRGSAARRAALNERPRGQDALLRH